MPDSSGTHRARIETPDPGTNETATIRRTVAAIMGVIVELPFLFGFGVSPWVAPLVAPAVDLPVIALLLGTQHLASRDTDAL